MLKSLAMHLPEPIRKPVRSLYHVWKAPRIHEPEFEWIAPYLSGVAIDVGANIGKFTVFCAKHSPHVFSIEPAEENIRTLNIAKRLYHLSNVDIIHAAASDHCGKLSFSVPTFSDGSPNLYECHVSDNGTFDVNAITLDSLNLCPTFIKIDVEGHELEVLKGALQTIERSHPAMLIEVLHSETEKTLSDIGYKRVRSLGVNGMFLAEKKQISQLQEPEGQLSHTSRSAHSKSD